MSRTKDEPKSRREHEKRSYTRVLHTTGSKKGGSRPAVREPRCGLPQIRFLTPSAVSADPVDPPFVTFPIWQCTLNVTVFSHSLLSRTVFTYSARTPLPRNPISFSVMSQKSRYYTQHEKRKQFQIPWCTVMWHSIMWSAVVWRGPTCHEWRGLICCEWCDVMWCDVAWSDIVRRGLVVLWCNIEPCGQQVVARDGDKRRCELYTAGSTPTSGAVFPTAILLFDTLSWVDSPCRPTLPESFDELAKCVLYMTIPPHSSLSRTAYTHGVRPLYLCTPIPFSILTQV